MRLVVMVALFTVLATNIVAVVTKSERALIEERAKEM
jgi:hypothetical protein